MQLRSGAHLTYCTNIHPGESWDEVRRNVETQVQAVKAQVCPERPFGVGLRLSAVAARQLGQPAELARFRDYLAAHGLYVFTINAFPYGPFHGQPVKEGVYRPDWLEPERLAYSGQVATILTALLPAAKPGEPSLSGSISTVPGCFRPRAPGAAELAAMGSALGQHAAVLWRLHQAGGAPLGLALEPEPECVMETSADAIEFLSRQVFAGPGASAFRDASGLQGAAAEEALRRHVGLCLDACHAAVEFEEPAAALAALDAAGVRVLKLQVSAGLRILQPDRARLRELARFAEGVYLHQVVIRRDRALARIADLPQALAAVDLDDPGDEWRVHFHVPLFREALGSFASTQPFLADLLARQRQQPFTDHLEVETYTWDVLPEEFRNQPVADAVARELSWVLGQLEPPS
jgi:sugar phosphate isomerase/epimerase